MPANRLISTRFPLLLSTLATITTGVVSSLVLTPRPAVSIPLNTPPHSQALRFFKPHSYTNPNRLNMPWIPILSGPKMRESEFVEMWKISAPARLTFVSSSGSKTVTPPQLTTASGFKLLPTAVHIPIGFDRNGRFLFETHSEEPNRVYPNRSRVPEYITWIDLETNEHGNIPIPQVFDGENDWRTIGFWPNTDRLVVTMLQFKESGSSKLYQFDLASAAMQKECELELAPAGMAGLGLLNVSPDAQQLFVPAQVEDDFVGPEFEQYVETIVGYSVYDTQTGNLLGRATAVEIKSRIDAQLESIVGEQQDWIYDVLEADFAPFRTTSSEGKIKDLITGSGRAYLLVSKPKSTTAIEVWTTKPQRPIVTVVLMSLIAGTITWWWLKRRHLKQANRVASDR
ncbi:MAG: YncE family protein [Planctomycetaceae bacterium]